MRQGRVFFEIFSNGFSRKNLATSKVVLLLGILVFFSIIFTAIFQIPLDWDGMDYHLPPMVEFWQNGHWGRSLNPYFQAQDYPKTASSLFLWWLIHFGKLFGLRSLLCVAFFHWVFGLLASFRLFGFQRWVLLIWLGFPLIARQSVSAYADLPGLVSLLGFCVFFFEKKYWQAVLALFIHSSIKFTNIGSGFAVLFSVLIWWRMEQISFSRRKKIWLFFVGAFLAGCLLTPIDNIVHGNKPFGHLKCKVFGTDFCGGSVDPESLVVAPVIDIPKDASWFSKVARGWIPSQMIPGSDVPHGGFGGVWIVVIFLLFWNFRQREGQLNFGILRAVPDPAFCACVIVMISDLLIPALWYPRYHLGFGWVMCMMAAMWFDLAERNLHLKKGLVPLFIFACGLLSAQLVWVLPQRTWFLGVHSVQELPKIKENLSSIVEHGYPLYATHSADIRTLDFLKLENKKISICGTGFRPVLGAYGVTLTNRVIWYEKDCPETKSFGDRLPDREIVNEGSSLENSQARVTQVWVE